MNSFKTNKGTELELLNLRGKPYLQVAGRFVWLNEDVNRFNISTEIVRADKDESIVRALVQIYNDQGALVKSATATKREVTKDFPDHLEKAETSAVGRALAMLGYGTQFCTQDFAEGERLADSPVAPAKRALATAKAADASLTSAPVPATAPTVAPQAVPALATGTRPTFRRSTAPTPIVAPGVAASAAPKAVANDF